MWRRAFSSGDITETEVTCAANSREEAQEFCAKRDRQTLSSTGVW